MRRRPDISGKMDEVNSALTLEEGNGVGTSSQDRNAQSAFNLPLFLLSPRSITALALRGGPKKGNNSGLTAGAPDKEPRGARKHYRRSKEVKE
ncbi:MAG: hypothetical protein IKR37_01430 [Paludibacteraceae bacterium]|nr:hypothetical protein [Paludibacteraceae bacterium]